MTCSSRRIAQHIKYEFTKDVWLVASRALNLSTIVYYTYSYRPERRIYYYIQYSSLFLRRTKIFSSHHWPAASAGSNCCVLIETAISVDSLGCVQRHGSRIKVQLIFKAAESDSLLIAFLISDEPLQYSRPNMPHDSNWIYQLWNRGIDKGEKQFVIVACATLQLHKLGCVFDYGSFNYDVCWNEHVSCVVFAASAYIMVWNASLRAPFGIRWPNWIRRRQFGCFTRHILTTTEPD